MKKPKATYCSCEKNFAEGFWIRDRSRGDWTFLCPDCCKEYEAQFPPWRYSEKRKEAIK